MGHGMEGTLREGRQRERGKEGEGRRKRREGKGREGARFHSSTSFSPLPALAVWLTLRQLYSVHIQSNQRTTSDIRLSYGQTLDWLYGLWNDFVMRRRRHPAAAAAAAAGCGRRLRSNSAVIRFRVGCRRSKTVCRIFATVQHCRMSHQTAKTRPELEVRPEFEARIVFKDLLYFSPAQSL